MNNLDSKYWAEQIKKVHPYYEEYITGGNFPPPNEPKELMRVLGSKSNSIGGNVSNISENNKRLVCCVLVLLFFFWFSFRFAKGSNYPTFDFILGNVNIFTIPTWIFLSIFVSERKNQVRLQYLIDKFKEAYAVETAQSFH